MNAPDVLTRADKLFEAACEARGIKFRRIQASRVAGRQRPDYRIDIPGCGAFVEVKQIDPNKDDRRYTAELKTKGIASRSIEPGVRVRKAIKEAADQLRQASVWGALTGVAIFDAAGTVDYTDPNAVITAMFGVDQMVIGVPRDLNQSPYFKRMKRGGKRGVTEAENTSVSAVIVIREVPHLFPAPQLLVYLNPHARVPINETHLRGYVWARYVFGEAENGRTGWIEADD